jgi:hypothetical protein
VLGVKKTNAAVAKKAPAKPGRKALTERKDVNGSDTEEVDEFDEEEEVAPAKTTKRGRPAKAQKPQDDDIVEAPAPAKRGRKPTAKEPVAKKEPKTKAAARSKTKTADAEAEPPVMTIPETQPEPDLDPMDVEDSIEVDEIPESMPPPPRPSARRAQAQPSRSRQTSAGARRAGSASDSERDPALRRKVGDLTRKLESMTVKYDALKEAATSGKESNFDQLKKRTEQAAKGTIQQLDED